MAPCTTKSFRFLTLVELESAISQSFRRWATLVNPCKPLAPPSSPRTTHPCKPLAPPSPPCTMHHHVHRIPRTMHHQVHRIPCHFIGDGSCGVPSSVCAVKCMAVNVACSGGSVQCTKPCCSSCLVARNPTITASSSGANKWCPHKEGGALFNWYKMACRE